MEPALIDQDIASPLMSLKRQLFISPNTPVGPDSKQLHTDEAMEQDDGSPVLKTVRAADDRNTTFPTRRNTIASPVGTVKTIASSVGTVETIASPMGKVKTIAGPVRPRLSSEPQLKTIASSVGTVKTIAGPVRPRLSSESQLLGRKRKLIRRKLVPGQQLLPEIFSKSKFKPSHFNSTIEMKKKVTEEDGLEENLKDSKH